ncbi:ribosomal protein, small subunit, putative [Candida dubliniensis CD36]|nr:40S ribosomal protein S20 [Candida dubliniensis CD36]CAX40320.1 ribosomal protein, small subunit, putative [Candida dubliniensis CD36]
MIQNFSPGSLTTLFLETFFSSLTTSTYKQATMSAPINKEKVEQEAEQQIHKIRITLTSTKVKQLENVSANIIRNAAQYNIVKKGPVRMPTKVLKITTRKTPNGEGSKTWDAYEMRIHKRVIDLQAPASTVKRITQITIEPGVDVEVTIAA